MRHMVKVGKMKLGGMKPGLLALSGLAVLAGGCTSLRDHRGYLIDQALVDSVQPGIDNRLSVERSLGRPTFTSQFGEPVWYYVSVDTRTPTAGTPRTTKETVLRVRFAANGDVARVDKAGLEKVVHIRPDGAFTETAGKKRTFLEDLFGNIGTVGAGMGGQGGQGGGGSGGGGGGPNGS